MRIIIEALIIIIIPVSIAPPIATALKSSRFPRLHCIAVPEKKKQQAQARSKKKKKKEKENNTAERDRDAYVRTTNSMHDIRALVLAIYIIVVVVGILVIHIMHHACVCLHATYARARFDAWPGLATNARSMYV